MSYKFVDNGSRKKDAVEVRPEDILITTEVGEYDRVQLAKGQYPNRQTGGVNHVVKILGIGNPTTFGPEKFVALTKFMDAIGKHFVSLGLLEKEEEE